MTNLTIGFDAKRTVRNATGLGNYCRTLLNDLGSIDHTDSLRLYVPDLGRDDLRSQLNMQQNMQFVLPTNTPKLLKGLWRIRNIVNDLKRDHVDIYHGLTGELPMGIHKAGIKSVVTIHDLIFLRHPEYYKPIDVMIYRWKFHYTCREADKIVAISECTKRDIMEFGNVAEDKIELIYQSCGTRFKTKASEEQKEHARKHYALPNRYILFVGTIEERKNALLAAQALPYLDQNIHLVLVGRRTKYADKIEDFVKKNNLTERVHFLSGVPTSNLYAIYQMAECFVYPSRYEGFGIPIIEAIQSGLPVVACTGSCLEEAGGPDNLYVDPDKPQDMAEAIKTLIANNETKKQIVAKSQQYVTRFENNDIAAFMLKLYQSL